MKLVLGLPPDDAARLPRLARLAGLTADRRRRRAVSVVWHDTVDGTLAGRGLALAEQGRLWRLETLAPEAKTWPPGATEEVLAQATALARLDHELPAGLLAVAQLDGHIITLPLHKDGVGLTLTLLQGTLGWARRRRPVCRLTLEGPTGLVLELALALAAELELAIPAAALAAEAQAVANASAPAGAAVPELRTGLSVGTAFELSVGRHAGAILREAQTVLSRDPGTEPVHQMRVAVRRLRSTIAVFRPAVFCPEVDAADQSLKALADRLGPARDLDVFVAETAATVGEALPEDASLARLRVTAEHHRRAAYTALRAWLRGAEFRRLAILLAALAEGTAWLTTTEAAQQAALGLKLETFAAQALKRRLRRLTEAGDTIDHLDPTALHLIRLRAKRMRYAAEIFAPLFPRKATARFLRRLAAVQDRLGILNDAAVANTLLTELGATTGGRAHAAGLVRGFLAARAGDARGRIARAWQRFHRLEPFWT
jgi:CHAD domain-containing protein